MIIRGGISITNSLIVQRMLDIGTAESQEGSSQGSTALSHSMKHWQ